MSTQSDFTKSSYVVHMSSLGNKGLLKKKKDTTTMDQKDYDEYILQAIHSNFSLDKAQTLLVKDCYILMKNPLHFVATHSRVSKTVLVAAIRVKREDELNERNSYIPFLVEGTLDDIGLSVKYQESLMGNTH
jgi:hypothetical protein